jgi:hypothetical protein
MPQSNTAAEVPAEIVYLITVRDACVKGFAFPGGLKQSRVSVSVQVSP